MLTLLFNRRRKKMVKNNHNKIKWFRLKAISARPATVFNPHCERDINRLRLNRFMVVCQKVHTKKANRESEGNSYNTVTTFWFIVYAILERKNSTGKYRCGKSLGARVYWHAEQCVGISRHSIFTHWNVSVKFRTIFSAATYTITIRFTYSNSNHSSVQQWLSNRKC